MPKQPDDVFNRWARWSHLAEAEQGIIRMRQSTPLWQFLKVAVFYALKTAITGDGPYRWQVAWYAMREAFRGRK